MDTINKNLYDLSLISRTIRELRAGNTSHITRIGMINILEEYKITLKRIDDLLERNNELLRENRLLKEKQSIKVGEE